MYLSNIELKKVVEKVISDVENTEHKFEPDSQIKVCSIDIRVSNIFWVMTKQARAIDLSSRYIFEISPTRLWKRRVIEDSGYIKLKPGEMILGRTHEKISMPDKYVGKINTRSSYARLGLSTACNCDLINPGYSGHVPLELINSTPNVMYIRPYLPLCQVFIMPVYGEIDDSYNSEKYESKYIDDEGEPSVWWRDALVKKLSLNVFKNQLESKAINSLRKKFKEIDDNGLFRLEKFMDEQTFSDSTDLIEKFSRSEKNKYNWYKTRRNLSLWLCPALFVATLIQIQNKLLPEDASPDIITWSMLSSFIISVPFFLFYVFRKKVKYYCED
ncbi:dCTP deaminase [Kangiella sp.]|uniref:dCTP deaminase n=1 Tax=Kangiella sp. TaxID=1920245 RepID=UPI0019A2124A|nr:dCTP deaminase [Kangiella sp.]MBD3653870.1 dCTP deaminase [Kangiella sp.]